MSTLVKSTVLSLGLLAGVAFAAQAQSGSIAALPPGAAPSAATAPVGPTGYPGPNPGTGYYGGTVEKQAPVTPSPQYVGPGPGGGWYGATPQTQPVVPSPTYIGPRPN